MADTSTDNQPEPAPPTDMVGADSFGDLLAQLLQSLPAEASRLFLMALSGLSPSESAELCRYVDRLRDEKQFRVIKAMAESTVDGKKKFILNLRKKFIAQEAKLAEDRAQEEQNMETYLRRKHALTAVNKFHSLNAVIGPDSADNDGHKLTSQQLAGMPNADGVVTGRSLSSSSVVISKEDISLVGRLLSNSHIGDSEKNLRELEINKKGFTIGDKSATTATQEQNTASKRDRPQSTHALIEGEQKPTQRTRHDASTPEASSSFNVERFDENTENGENPEAPTTKRWTKSQDAALRESVRVHGEKNWKAIAELVPGRNHAQCLQRWRKVLKPGLVKGHWSFEEDQVLEYLVTQGCNNWGQIAERIPGRTPKQCRERWKNHLDPAINKGPYTEEEDSVILTAQARLGNKWSQIAQLLKGRTEDSVKIRWKSLKQNPSKAAASHAQHKKNQQQAQAAAQHAAMDYHNSALMRQRQLQLLQQQQHLQVHNNAEAVQQLDQQQHMQQMRLHEKMLQQMQQGRHISHVAMLTEDLKVESYQPNRAMLMGHSPGGDANLYAAAAYAQQSYVPPQQYNGQGFVATNCYDPRNYERSTPKFANTSPVHQTDHHQQDNSDTWLQPSTPAANGEIDQQQRSRRSQHVSSNGSILWDPYSRQDASQLSPLSLQALLQDPSRGGELDSSFYQPVEQQPEEAVAFTIGDSSFGSTPTLTFPHTHAL
ncbi:myb-like dna-binding [Plasmopara halstedii]|uniref:Myb-like dna-binding n=1 Tax=Plasmopara halstedii TaxID=4781 RepID=A0A0N7L5K4_PLAHL|nr:myb-like dna-binding [Plasmopara halstedii]CEG41723.1 myb-like dna-binding [Plasmopara halstedii]|eukprot:XP_024578092.1 myb-like dna-binding [Plasmopara halstedii]